jgi:hypothetical protein
MNRTLENNMISVAVVCARQYSETTHQIMITKTNITIMKAGTPGTTAKDHIPLTKETSHKIMVTPSIAHRKASLRLVHFLPSTRQYIMHGIAMESVQTLIMRTTTDWASLARTYRALGQYPSPLLTTPKL